MWKSEEDAAGLPPALTTMATYREAVDEFTRNATALIGHIPLFTKAREAYDQAMRASANLRTVLDAGDETLRILMVELEQAVNLHLPVPEDRKPEPLRFDALNPEVRTSLAANG
jgi:hypothetical protein